MIFAEIYFPLTNTHVQSMYGSSSHKSKRAIYTSRSIIKISSFKRCTSVVCSMMPGLRKTWLLIYNVALELHGFYDFLTAINPIDEYAMFTTTRNTYAYIKFENGVHPKNDSCFDIERTNGHYIPSRGGRDFLKRYFKQPREVLANFNVKSFINCSGKQGPDKKMIVKRSIQDMLDTLAFDPGLDKFIAKKDEDPNTKQFFLDMELGTLSHSILEINHPEVFSKYPIRAKKQILRANLAEALEILKTL